MHQAKRENEFSADIISVLKKGGIGVLATDTLYGLVGSALIPETVDCLYAARGRPSNKPSIILISSVNELEKFSVKIQPETKKMLLEYWPGPVSIIFPCIDEKLKYLHKGKKSLAFRIPDQPQLQNLLKQTGPLLAPSANLEGKPVARTIQEARRYFGESVDFYVDSGLITTTLPSTILRLKDGKMSLVRKGAHLFIPTS